MTRILAQNEKDTLSTGVAVADLRNVLTATEPDLGILNEWNKNRDAATRKMCADLGYGYGRPNRGGGPVLWKSDKFRLRSLKSRILALPELVGDLPGRRSRLGTSWASEAIFTDSLGWQVALVGCHLTAEIQDMRGGGGYKTDRAHRLRVMRHKREKRRLGRRARRLERRRITTYPGGDTNYSGMQLGGFVNCWDGYPGGDLQGRAVTIVYATGKPTRRPRTVKTHSDHLAVVVDYA
jgi:hypothetical protein